MQKLDFLIEIRQFFVARVTNYKLESVMTHDEWRKIALEAVKLGGVTYEQEKFLKEMGISQEEIDAAKGKDSERSMKGVC